MSGQLRCTEGVCVFASCTRFRCTHSYVAMVMLPIERGFIFRECVQHKHSVLDVPVGGMLAWRCRYVSVSLILLSIRLAQPQNRFSNSCRCTIHTEVTCRSTQGVERMPCARCVCSHVLTSCICQGCYYISATAQAYRETKSYLPSSGNASNCKARSDRDV